MRIATHRHPSISTIAWLGMVVLAFILQSAAPMLAAAAAKVHGVMTVEVCSVYGVSAIPLDAPSAERHKVPDSSDHLGKSHCPLASLGNTGNLHVFAPAVVLHAPPQGLTLGFARPALSPLDASQLWLASRLHAPPVSV